MVQIVNLILGIIVAIIGLAVLFKFGGMATAKEITGFAVGLIFVVIGVLLALFASGLI